MRANDGVVYNEQMKEEEMSKEIFVDDGTGVAVTPREMDWSKIPSIGWPETLKEQNFNKVRRFSAQFNLPWFMLRSSDVRAKERPRVAKAVESLLEYDWADDFDRPLLKEKAEYAMQILRDFTARIEEEITRHEAEEAKKKEAFHLARERVRELMESRMKPLLEEALNVLEEMKAADRHHDALAGPAFTLHEILKDPECLMTYREKKKRPAVTTGRKSTPSKRIHPGHYDSEGNLVRV